MAPPQIDGGMNQLVIGMALPGGTISPILGAPPSIITSLPSSIIKYPGGIMIVP